MYIIGFLAAWFLASLRAKKPNSGWTSNQIGDLLFYCALGVVIGGRVGYMLFYNLPYFLAHPLTLFKVWDGGMSFHGGVIGVAIAVWWYGRHISKSFFEITDFIAPLVPIGLGAGRIGNFINGELWGQVTNVPWAMVFPTGGPLPRHPSQLYEFFLEGVVLFVILWFYSAKPKPRMAVSGLFCLCYGIFRFIVEFFRQPDIQLGYLAFGWLTMGQLLSTPLILLGVGLLWWAYSRPKIADKPVN
jgi:phosphatidylglycerol:prolipoprotein diacylglycerol transferase